MFALLLIFGLLIVLSIPRVQSSLAQRLTRSLNQDYGVAIDVEKLGLNWKGVIDLRGVLIKDHHQDTLISAKSLTTNVLTLADLKKNRWTFGQLGLEDALLKIITYPDESQHSLDHFINQFVTPGSTQSSGNPFVLLIGRMALANTKIQIQDQNLASSQNLTFNRVFLSAKDFRLSGPDLTAKISSMGFDSNFGLHVAELSGDYRYGPEQMALSNMKLITPATTQLVGDLSLSYKDGMADFANKVYLDVALKPESNIATSDINTWYDAFDPGGFIETQGSLHGTLNRLNWTDAVLRYKNSLLTGQVMLKNMINQAPFDLEIPDMKLSSRRDDLVDFMPKSLGTSLPATLKRLGKTTLSGAFHLKGDFLSFDGLIASSLGRFNANFELGNLDLPDYAFYSGVFETKGLRLGNLFQSDDLGFVSGRLDIKGRGFSSDKLNTSLSLNLEELQYLNYVYRNLDLTADLIAPFQKWSWSISDPYLETSGSLKIDQTPLQKQFGLVTSVDFADLNALGLVKRDDIAEFSAGVTATAYGSDYDALSGTLELKNAFYQTQERYYFFESLNLDVLNNADQKRLAISAPDVVQGELSGNFLWGQMTDLLTNALGASYMNYEPISVQPNQSLVYDFTVYHKFVDVFLPELELGRETRLKGELSDVPDTFELAFDAPELLLFGNYFGGVHVLIDNNHPLFRSALSVDSVYTGTRYFNDLKWVNGNTNDTVQMSVSFKGGKKRQDDYQLNLFQTRDSLNNVVFGLNQSTLALGDQIWEFNRAQDANSHRLTIDQGGSMTLSPLILSNQSERIRLEGYKKGVDDLNIQMEFDQVNIDHILPSIEDLKLDGTLDGQLQFRQIEQNFFPSSNLMLTEFGINDVAMGDLSLAITGNSDLTKYSINSTLNQSGQNKFKAIGAITLEDKQPNLDLNLSLRNLDLSALSPLGRTVLSDINGEVDGRIRVQGLYNAPEVNGNLILNNTRLRIPYLNIDLAVEERAKIEVLNGAFRIPSTILTDRKYDTQADLSGVITHDNFQDWALDLEMSTDRFLALDTPPEESVLYFGTTFISGGASIRGPADELIIDVTAETQEGTSFKIPISDVASVGDDSFIRFISPEEKLARINGTTFVPDEIKGLTVNFDLDINDEAEVEILVDPANNSKFKGRGTGLMFIEINTLGKFKMWGEFIVIEGIYDFKYGGIVDKTIDVVPGGRISWNGAADEAQLDLTAKYRVEDVNPSALLDNPSLNSTVDVEVLLNLTGQIMQPELDFQLDFPNVSSAVRDELNVKLNEREQRQLQAIYLAATGSFQGDGGQNIVGTLTERVNKLVADLLADSDSKFKILPTIGTRQVDLDAQLEYNVGVQISTQISERVLINGKVAVPVGGANDSAVAGDIQVQWLVNDDGSLRMNFFNRQADLQFIGEDQIFEQGAGASYTVDFATFQELFYKLFGKKIDKDVL